MSYCSNCGTKIEKNDLFCGNCGVRQEEDIRRNDSNEGSYNTQKQFKSVVKWLLLAVCIIGVSALLIIIIQNKELGSNNINEIDTNNSSRAVDHSKEEAQSNYIKVPQDYATIQDAIDNSENGQVIVVDEGIYNENINLRGKSIKLQSSDPYNSEIVENTIIIGANGSVITIDSGEDRNAIITGFTITGGKGKQNTYTVESYDGSVLTFKRNYGGGIYISNSSPTITGNIISENRVSNINKTDLGVGGGIAILYHSSPLITDNIIANNYSEGHGGGIAVWYHSKPVLSNNTIYDNKAGDIGGGLMIALICAPEITGNVITSNQAVWGGGLYIAHMSDASIVGNIIEKNSADLGAGLFLRKIDKTTIKDNEFLANEAKLEGSVLHLNNSASATFIDNYLENNRAPFGGDTIKIEKDSRLIIANPDNNIYKNNNP